MMDGITVLSQSEITTKPCWIWIFLFVSLFVIILGVVLATICASFNKKIGTKLGTVFTIFGIVLFFIDWLCGIIITVPTGKYTYKVTISDEVNFVEFNNKYEIIDQDGLIYTIKEKESNNESN